MRRTPWFRGPMYVPHASTRTEFQEHAIVEPHARHPVGEVPPWPTSGMDLLRRSYLLACGYNKPLPVYRRDNRQSIYRHGCEPAAEISLLITTHDRKQLPQRWEATYGELRLIRSLLPSYETQRKQLSYRDWKSEIPNGNSRARSFNSVIKLYLERWR